MTTLRQIIGRAKTLFYRRPLEESARMIRWGPRAYFSIDKWKREMESAASQLPVIRSSHPSSNKHIAVWFLTGERFWYQTAFCAWSLAYYSNLSLVLNLVSDGSLTGKHEDSLRRLFPDGLTIRKEETCEKIDDLLPVNAYPTLRKRWDDYVNIRKLTDIHLGSTGAKLVLDSDMLFFRCPDALLGWWGDHQETLDCSRNSGVGNLTETRDSFFRPLLMTDCEESYGYSRSLMEELTGSPIPPLINVGICGLRSEDLDWEELEYWCCELVSREGANYFLEQALVAMLASKVRPKILPANHYITLPTKNQVIRGEGILQHFVSDSKPLYFDRAWKLIYKD